jgi:hypothetical protein
MDEAVNDANWRLAERQELAEGGPAASDKVIA